MTMTQNSHLQYRLSNKDSIVAVRGIEIVAVEDSHSIFVLAFKIAEELDEANFVVDLEFWAGSHRVRYSIAKSCERVVYLKDANLVASSRATAFKA